MKQIIVVLLILAYFGTFFYMIFLEDRFTEVDNSDYVYAKKYYSIHPATKDLYCEFLKSGNMLSEHEDMELHRLMRKHDRNVQNVENKEAVEKIKAENCK